MGEQEAERVPALIILGPGTDRAVVDCTRRVLTHYEIPFREVGWHELEAVSSGELIRFKVIVFATGVTVTYSDEHLRLPEASVVPVVMVITTTTLPATWVPTSTRFIMTAGFGIAGGTNAGYLTARILSSSDPTLAALLTSRPYSN